MPSNKDLPENAQDLPSGAKTIWRKSFNAALEEYDSKETATKIAWATIKRVYQESDDGHWIKKEGHIAGSFSGLVTLAPLPDDNYLQMFGGKATAGELLYFKGTLARAEANKNKDEIDVQGVEEVCSTLPLMPIDIEHRNRDICGVYLRAEPTEDGTAVGTEGIIYARRFPEVAEGLVDGTYKFSIEAWAQEATCSECSETFTKTSQYCQHLKSRYRGGNAIRKLSGLSAYGGAVTKNPAGTDCTVDDDSLLLLASEEDEDLNADVGEVQLVAMSLEKMQDMMKQKMKTMMGEGSGYGWLEETNPETLTSGNFIWTQDSYDTNESKSYSVPYSFDDNGECALGEMTEMEQVWQPKEGMPMSPDRMMKDMMAKVTSLESSLETLKASSEEVNTTIEASKNEYTALQGERDTVIQERDSLLTEKVAFIAEKNSQSLEIVSLKEAIEAANARTSNAQAELKASERVTKVVALLGSETMTKDELVALSDDAFETYLAGIEAGKKQAKPGQYKGMFGGKGGADVPTTFAEALKSLTKSES